MQTVIAVVLTFIVTAVLVYFVTTAYHKKVADTKIGNADEKAREIIDEAVKAAETKKREAMLEAKEDSIRVKNDLDKEVKERRAEIQRSERRIVQKEENLDKKLESIERREAGFAAKEEEINKQKAQIVRLNEERVQELERISGLTSEQAKEYLLKTVEEDVKLDTAKLIKEMEHKAKEEADKKAKEYVVTAIQKCAADHVADRPAPSPRAGRWSPTSSPARTWTRRGCSSWPPVWRGPRSTLWPPPLWKKAESGTSPSPPLADSPPSTAGASGLC